MKILPINSYTPQSRQMQTAKTTVKSVRQNKGNTYNKPISFGFYMSGNMSRPTGVIEEFIDKKNIDKAHLEQIVNFTINELAEDSIKEDAPHVDCINLYNFGRTFFSNLWRVNYQEKITVGDVRKSLEKTLEKEPDAIKSFEQINDSNDYYERNRILIKRDFAKKLIQKLSNLDSEAEIFKTFDYYDLVDEMAQEIYKEHQKDYMDYVSKVRRLVQYGDDEEVEKFDVEEEFKKLTPSEQEYIIKEHGEDTNEMCLNYLAERGSSDFISMPSNPNFETAILQTLPRYDAAKSIFKKSGEFEVEPLYRWLRIDNINEFLKQFKIGEEYSYNRSQSCSKKSDSAEHVWYGDMNKDQCIKFRIHPKGKKSKAYDFQSINCNRRTFYYYDDKEPRYRTAEAIYPANTKFRVLGIYKNCLNTYTQGEKINRETKDNFKIIIDLQEI